MITYDVQVSATHHWFKTALLKDVDRKVQQTTGRRHQTIPSVNVIVHNGVCHHR